jgi:hypothetical protein
MAKGSGYDINIITKGGVKTSVDAESQHPIKIQKAMPRNAKYDPAQQKEFFKSAVDMFRNIPIPSTTLKLHGTHIQVDPTSTVDN